MVTKLGRDLLSFVSFGAARGKQCSTSAFNCIKWRRAGAACFSLGACDRDLRYETVPIPIKQTSSTVQVMITDVSDCL